MQGLKPCASPAARSGDCGGTAEWANNSIDHQSDWDAVLFDDLIFEENAASQLGPLRGLGIAAACLQLPPTPILPLGAGPAFGDSCRNACNL